MKLPLLTYLDQLEATAKRSLAGPCGPPWTIERDGSSGIVGIVSPNVDANPVAETVYEVDAAHILATQPRATLALIAKLREAVALVADARSDTWCHSYDGRADALVDIEVPE